MSNVDRVHPSITAGLIVIPLGLLWSQIEKNFTRDGLYGQPKYACNLVLEPGECIIEPAVYSSDHPSRMNTTPISVTSPARFKFREGAREEIIDVKEK